MTNGATGVVTFKEGATTLGTGNLSGGSPNIATFSTSAFTIGTHAITAVYAGDANFLGSTSNVVTQTVNGTLNAPANFVATATAATNVAMSWNAVAGADHYEVWRRQNGGFSLVGVAPGTTFNDSTVLANNSYVYYVRAAAAGNASFSGFSNVDFATTVMFDNDPLVPNVTVMTAAHMMQLRDAVNALRAVNGLPPAVYTSPAAPGSLVRASDINELRTALVAARNAFGLGTTFFNATRNPGARIRAVDFQEIRDQVK